METIFFFLPGIAVGWFLCWGFRAIRMGSFHQQARNIILEAERAARSVQEKKNEEVRALLHVHTDKIRQEIDVIEREKNDIKQQKKALAKETEKARKDSDALSRMKKEHSENELILSQTICTAQKKLEQISNMTFEQAKKELWLQAEAACKKNHEKLIQEWQSVYDQECQRRASSILFSALERKTQSLTKETFITEILVPERTIPKLIGKEGRNIHTLEALLDVILKIDESENKVQIIAHDPKRRLLAKATIELVTAEEKVTPITIKNACEKTQNSLCKIFEDKGRETCQQLGIAESLSPEIFKALGELSQRSSAGQNVLLHSVEVAELMAIISKELGFCSEKAKMLGLFHDIGKSLSPDWGASHALSGSRFLKQFGFDEHIVQGIASHHGEAAPPCFEAVLLPLCDRLSAELPGARKNEKPLFLELVKECEEKAKNVPGVFSAWAHYAGNHIELVVRPTADASHQSVRSTLDEVVVSLSLRLPVKISLL